MGKASDTSPRKYRGIQTLLLHSTHSQRDIAAIVGVSKSVVNRIKIKMDSKIPIEANRVGKCGRKRITTPRTDRKIRDTCLENRKKSVILLTTMMNDKGVKISERTVRRWLVEENLMGRRPAKKPRLTNSMKQKRQQWARQHRNMTIADWSRGCPFCRAEIKGTEQIVVDAFDPKKQHNRNSTNGRQQNVDDDDTEDLGDFNIATSSLHALSNSMAASRAEKPSPHSSPRSSRRCATPNIVAVQNDLYAVNQSALHNTMQSATVSSSSHGLEIQQPRIPNQVVQPLHPTTPPHSTVNSNVGNASQPKPSISKTTNANRISATMVGAFISDNASQIGNKVLNKALSAENNDIVSHHTNDFLTGTPIISNAALAPPLPPRKTSPGVENSLNRSLKPQNNMSAASSLSDLSDNSTCQTINQYSSTENIATNYESEVPKTTAPPIPRHQQTRTIDTTANDLRNQRIAVINDDIDKVIVGPAETITGIIDTRPLEARKPIIISVVNSYEKETTSVNNSNNLYHLKTASTPNNNLNNDIRHQSRPNTSAPQSQQIPLQQQKSPHCNSTSSTKSIGTQRFGSDNQQQGMTMTPRSTTPNSQNVSNHQLPTVHQGSHHSHQQRQQHTQQDQSHSQQPLLYENLTINTKDCNVPYENINLEYIARLMNEGYSKENAITALGISRNNIEMACDILHEFVSKSSV